MIVKLEKLDYAKFVTKAKEGRRSTRELAASVLEVWLKQNAPQ